MPIYRGKTKVVSLYRGTTKIVKVYKGTNVVYTSFRLPSEYQQVKYIQNSGTQYIDTGWKYNFNNGFKVISEFNPLTNPRNSSRCALLGNYNGVDTDNNFSLEARGTNIVKAYFQGSDYNTANYSVITGQRNIATVEINGNDSYVKCNQSTTNFVSTFSGSAVNSCWVFIDRQQRYSTFSCYYKLYSLKIYDGGILVRDYIPCYRKSDRVVGLYDAVNDVFYTNAGTGEFIRGPIVDIPNAYQEVEYIESSGTQYIDTQLNGTNGYTFETKVVFTDFPNTYTYLAGFGTSSSNRIYFTRAQNTAYTDGYTFTTAINLTSTTIATNTEYVYRSIMKTGNQQYYRNDVLLGSGTNTTINEYSTIWLFTADYNGSPNGSASCKMYYAKFYYNDILVRDFIPVYRKSDNVIGLYDLVNGVFYTNAGTGTFTKGSNIE